MHSKHSSRGKAPPSVWKKERLRGSEKQEDTITKNFRSNSF